MLKDNKSLFEKDIKPLDQLKFALATTIGIQLVYYIFNHSDQKLETKITYYVIAIAFTLVFGLFNAVLSISCVDQNKYWGTSLVNYFIFCAITLTVAYFLSGIGIDEGGSFRWIYFVFTFSYLIFMAIVRTMRRIVFLAQKQDKRLRGED